MDIWSHFLYIFESLSSGEIVMTILEDGLMEFCSIRRGKLLQANLFMVAKSPLTTPLLPPSLCVPLRQGLT